MDRSARLRAVFGLSSPAAIAISVQVWPSWRASYIACERSAADLRWSSSTSLNWDAFLETRDNASRDRGASGIPRSCQLAAADARGLPGGVFLRCGRAYQSV